MLEEDIVIDAEDLQAVIIEYDQGDRKTGAIERSDRKETESLWGNLQRALITSLGSASDLAEAISWIPSSDVVASIRWHFDKCRSTMG